jgi:hypothetical protein
VDAARDAIVIPTDVRISLGARLLLAQRNFDPRLTLLLSLQLT